MDQKETLKQRLVASAIVYMGDAHQAVELCNTLACFGADEPELEEQFAAAIRKRIDPSYGAVPAITCSDVVCCAADLARAFRRWHLVNSWDGTLAGLSGFVGRLGPRFGKTLRVRVAA